MQDFDTPRRAERQLESLKESLSILMAVTKATSPIACESRILAELDIIKSCIKVPEVHFPVTLGKWHNYNSWRGGTWTFYMPEIDAETGKEGRIDMGVDINAYSKGKRKGWEIVLNVRGLIALLYRFDLFSLEGCYKTRNEAERWINKVAYGLCREPAKGKKAREEGKTRPRIFTDLEEAKGICEDFLLKLRLIEPIVGMETMHEVQGYNN